MKNTLLIILFLSFNVYAQDFNGKWYIISYEDEIAYYNQTTDSLSYKIPAKKNEAESFRKASALLIFPITYSFNDKGKFEINHNTMGIISSGRFEIDKLNKKVIMIDEKNKKEEISYTFDNQTLFIEMKMEIGFIKIGLNKVN